MKHCKYCKSEIPMDAKRCSHCHSWQRWFFNVDRSNAIINGTILGLLIFVIFATMMFIDSKIDDETGGSSAKNSLENCASDLKIVRKEMNFFECSTTQCLSLLLTVKNKTDSKIEDVYFYSEFFDKSGKLIDAETFENYDFYVPEKSERSLGQKILLKSAKENYHSVKVRVQYARKSTK